VTGQQQQQTKTENTDSVYDMQILGGYDYVTVTCSYVSHKTTDARDRE